MTHGILFPDMTRTTRMTTHSDSDYAESEDIKYTSGAVHFVYNSPVSWESGKQSILESISGSRALQHALWLCRLLNEMSIRPINQPVQFKTDNCSAIKIADHKSKTHLRKHIDICHHHLAHHIRLQ